MAEQQKEAKTKKEDDGNPGGCLHRAMVKELLPVRSGHGQRENKKSPIPLSSAIMKRSSGLWMWSLSGQRILLGSAGQREMRKDFFRGLNLWASHAPCALMPFAGSGSTSGEKNWARCLRMLRGGASKA